MRRHLFFTVAVVFILATPAYAVDGLLRADGGSPAIFLRKCDLAPHQDVTSAVFFSSSPDAVDHVWIVPSESDGGPAWSERIEAMNHAYVDGWNQVSVDGVGRPASVWVAVELGGGSGVGFLRDPGDGCADQLVSFDDGATFDGIDAGYTLALDLGVSGVAAKALPIEPETDASSRLSPHLWAAPNPFNPKTTIDYVIPVAGDVEIRVHNLRGARVATLVETRQVAGRHVVSWDGTDQNGKSVASGVYVATLRLDHRILQTRSLTLVR